jgi:subtilisin-like proprotein convertase family protein
MAAPVVYGPGTTGAILDLTTNDFTLSVPDSVVITDVNVAINLTHTFDGDLDIFLISPDNTVVELSTDNGSTGDNYTNTVFDDEAGTLITAGAAPFTGSFQPEGFLSDFDGENALGLWTLRIIDDTGADVGTLFSWSLTIDSNAPSSVPEPGTLSLLGIAGLALIGIRRRRKA